MSPLARRFCGQGAAPGFAHGPLVLMAEPRDTAAGPQAGDPGDRLQAALHAAVDALRALQARVRDEPARSILEFQLEFLSDPLLLESAAEALDGGADAAAAWCAAMDPMVADFASAGDDYFRERVTDLQDMRARVLAALAGVDSGPLRLPPEAILVADDLPPSRFLATDWQSGQAVVLRSGSPSSHLALLARARQVPMVVGLAALPPQPACRDALVDGAAGILVLDPDADERAAHGRRRAHWAQAHARSAARVAGPARTAAGEPVQVLVNVACAADLAGVQVAHCDGIGLVRTELLFAHGPPDEPTQLAAYRRLLHWAAGRPVTIRTLDAGADKPVPGLTPRAETNPFLGQRGVRLSLAHPVRFAEQLRALLRAAAEGDVRILLPMVTEPDEVRRVRALLDSAAATLRARSEPCGPVRLGMMVEVPAAALAVDAFEVDFLSIGSNDLLQYLMAAARDNATVSALADARHPAFTRLLGSIVSQARACGLPLSLCGDLAAQPEAVPLLLAAGLRTLSVPPAALGAVKAAIAAWPGGTDAQAG